MSAVIDTPPTTGTNESGDPTHAGAFGHATNLRCRECGAEQALGPYYACQECFGPLEVAYDFPTITRWVAEAGYAGAVEVEIFNADIWARPADEIVATMAERYATLVAPHL